MHDEVTVLRAERANLLRQVARIDRRILELSPQDITRANLPERIRQYVSAEGVVTFAQVDEAVIGTSDDIRKALRQVAVLDHFGPRGLKYWKLP